MENKYNLHLNDGKYFLDIDNIKTYSNVPIEGQTIPFFMDEKRFEEIVKGSLTPIREDRKAQVLSDWKREILNHFYVVCKVEHKFLNEPNSLETIATVKAKKQ
jgi:hypothetical protein